MENNLKKLIKFVPSFLMKLIITKFDLMNDNNIFLKENFPINFNLNFCILMKIKIDGIENLIMKLKNNDLNNQKEKLISEYLSNIYKQIFNEFYLLINKNGGEIVNFFNNEIDVIWNVNNKNKIKIFSIYSIITAIQLINFFNNNENNKISNENKNFSNENKKISNENKKNNLKLKIGLSFGKLIISFLGGINKKTNILFFDEAFNDCEECLNLSKNDEILINKLMYNNIKSYKIFNIEQIENKIYKILFKNFDEEEIKNKFNLEINNNNNFNIEKIKDKINFILSFLPFNLIKFINLNCEDFYNELKLLTIVNIFIFLNKNDLNNINFIQNLIESIQKISKENEILIKINKKINKLNIKIYFGLNNNSNVNDSAKGISSSILISNELNKINNNNNNNKICIGISTGNFFVGFLNNIFCVFGEKDFLCEKLCEEGNKIKNLNNNKIILIDKNTMKLSEKWFRNLFIGKINYFNDDFNDDFNENKIKKASSMKSFSSKSNENNENIIDTTKKKQKKSIKNNKSKNSNDSSLTSNNNNNNSFNSLESNEKNSVSNLQLEKILKNNNKNNNFYYEEFYSPIENEEFFYPKISDPFPLIRTHKLNTFNQKKTFINNNNNNFSFIKLKTIDLNSNEIKKNSLKKLKNSNTIFGYSNEINKIINLLNIILNKKLKQFFLIKGCLGTGKSLFIRKILNNFIGLNENLSKIYFNKNSFLLCNIIKPFFEKIPFNGIFLILRKIFLILIENKKNEKIIEIIKENNLNENNDYFLFINFVLSNFNDDFLSLLFNNKNNNFNNNKFELNLNKIKINNINFEKINFFFVKLLILYKRLLSNKLNIEYYNFPIILLIDDIQICDDFTLNFLDFLKTKNFPELQPLIIFMTFQIPFFNINNNNNKLNHNLFLNYTNNINNPNYKKIIIFTMKNLINKKEIEKLIIFYFRDLIRKIYKTFLEKVDDKILNFILLKSFNGNPLILINLMENLIYNNKYIQTLSGEFIETNELIESNKIFNWNDFILPNLFDRIYSEIINNFNEKNIVFIKICALIGTFFNLILIEKINFFNINLNDSIEKFLKMKIIDFFDFNNNNNEIVFEFILPFFKEFLYQKIPLEIRNFYHEKISIILIKNNILKEFNIENEISIIKNHLINSEIDINKEINKNSFVSINEIINIRNDFNLIEKKIEIMKIIYTNFYLNNNENFILKGKINLINEGKNENIFYLLNLNGIFCYLNENDFNQKKNFFDVIYIKNINDVQIINKNNNFILKIFCLFDFESNDEKIKNEREFFSSSKFEDLFKISFAIKIIKKELNNKIIKNNNENNFNLKIFNKNKKIFNENNKNFNIDKTILNESNFSFKLLFESSFSLFLGKIQKNIIKNNIKNINDNNNNDDNNENISIPEHLKIGLNKYFNNMYENKHKIIQEDEKSISFKQNTEEKINENDSDNQNNSENQTNEILNINNKNNNENKNNKNNNENIENNNEKNNENNNENNEKNNKNNNENKNKINDIIINENNIKKEEKNNIINNNNLKNENIFHINNVSNEKNLFDNKKVIENINNIDNNSINNDLLLKIKKINNFEEDSFELNNLISDEETFESKIKYANDSYFSNIEKLKNKFKNKNKSFDNKIKKNKNENKKNFNINIPSKLKLPLDFVPKNERNINIKRVNEHNENIFIFNVYNLNNNNNEIFNKDNNIINNENKKISKFKTDKILEKKINKISLKKDEFKNNYKINNKIHKSDFFKKLNS